MSQGRTTGNGRLERSAKDFENDPLYRNRTGWRKVKKLSPHFAKLCGRIEDLCRTGTLLCPREALAAAVHHFVNMTDRERSAAWLRMCDEVDRKRRGDDEQAMKLPDGFRIIETSDLQPGAEPGDTAYARLEEEDGLLWLYRDTPRSVRADIIAKAVAIFDKSRAAA